MGDDVDAAGTTPSRARRLVPTVLVVLAAVLAFASVFAIWAKRQLLETDTWTETTGALLAEPPVQRALAAYLTDQLYTHVDVPAQLEAALPPRLDPLAGPAAGALREAVQRNALNAVSDARFQRAWQDANRATHARLILLLEDRGRFLSTTDGVVTLDLRALVGEVAARAGLDPALADRLPEGAATLEIVRSDELDLAQSLVRAIRGLSIVLPLLTLALVALALYLGRGRRREVLRAAALGFVLAGVAVLVLRSLAGSAVTDAVVVNPAAEPAAERAWEIGTDMLRDGGVAVLLYGLVALLGAALAGPTRAARFVRGAIAPAARPQWAYPIAALLLAGLLWWGPTEGLRRPAPALILIVLLVLGIEVLRRQLAREAAAGELERPRLGFLAARRHTAERARLDELEQLGRLHASGMLTDAELATEKQRLLTA